MTRHSNFTYNIQNIYIYVYNIIQDQEKMKKKIAEK